MLDQSSPFKDVLSDPVEFCDVESALDYLCEIYAKNVSGLGKSAISDISDQSSRYPYVATYIAQNGVLESGFYGFTVSHPEILIHHYRKQFRHIIEECKSSLWIGISSSTMSLALIDEELFNSMTICTKNMPCMDKIRGNKNMSAIKSLGNFHAERIGYSLNRLHHYCGTEADYFQNTIVFVNYQIYCDFFMEYAQKQVDRGYYTKAIGPNVEYTVQNGLQKDRSTFKAPMPAYHLVGPKKDGITFINTNVGPSNIKTITDHLAVLHSERWIMLGHCAGIQKDNMVGDYIIGTSYLRDDYVLDRYVSKETPIPVCTELQKRFSDACAENYKLCAGTIVTTCDRNWELDSKMVDEFIAGQGIAVDMESSTLAANAFRFGVKSLSFLCISDMPLHGAPKLKSMASLFYSHKVREHLDICLEALMGKDDVIDIAVAKAILEEVELGA